MVASDDRDDDHQLDLSVKPSKVSTRNFRLPRAASPCSDCEWQKEIDLKLMTCVSVARCRPRCSRRARA